MIPSISEEKVLLLVLAVCVGSNFKQWSRGIIIRSVKCLLLVPISDIVNEKFWVGLYSRSCWSMFNFESHVLQYLDLWL